MECKVDFFFLFSFVHCGYSRSIVECKGDVQMPDLIMGMRYSRSIVECKVVSLIDIIQDGSLI